MKYEEGNFDPRVKNILALTGNLGLQCNIILLNLKNYEIKDDAISTETC
jgi:hypothetical protein